MTNRIDINIGDTVEIELPYSEVCMHLAGKRMPVTLKSQLWKYMASWHYWAEVSYPDGNTSDITYGEAGIYKDDKGFYTYI
jgi:hypothetical protein